VAGIVDLLRNIRRTLLRSTMVRLGHPCRSLSRIFSGNVVSVPPRQRTRCPSVGFIFSPPSFFHRRLLLRHRSAHAPSHIKHFLDTPKPLRLVCEIADEAARQRRKNHFAGSHPFNCRRRDSLSTNGDALLTIIQDKRSNEKVKEFRYGSLIALEGNFEHSDEFAKIRANSVTATTLS